MEMEASAAEICGLGTQEEAGKKQRQPRAMPFLDVLLHEIITASYPCALLALCQTTAFATSKLLAIPILPRKTLNSFTFGLQTSSSLTSPAAARYTTQREKKTVAVEHCDYHSDRLTNAALALLGQVINTIHYGAYMGQGSNMMSLPTDCDQRDE